MGVSRPMLGAAARVSIHRPRPARGGHSLAEVALGGATEPRDAIEVGWRVSAVLHGDEQPHLFVHRWVKGLPCWSDCGWTPWSGRWAPGDSLEALGGREVELGIVTREGRWWVWFEGEWLGYFEAGGWAGRLDVASAAE